MIWVLLTTGVHASALTTNPPPLTLDAAISLALNLNPTLRAARGNLDAAAGRADQSRTWPNPDLVLAAEDLPVNNGRGFPDSKQTAGIAQSLPFPGKKRLDHAIASSDIRRSEHELNLLRAELIRDVKTAFYQVLAAERLVGVANELVDVAVSSAVTARKRVTAGAAADQELLRAEITSEQAGSERDEFKRELDAARLNLALLLGRPDLKTSRIAGELSDTADLSVLEHNPVQWMAGHPGVLAVRALRDQAALELRRARLDPYPDVKVDVSGGRIGESGQSILQFGLSVPLPLFDRSKGKRREAQARLHIAEADQAAAEQRLLHAWETASQRLRSASEQVIRHRDRILPKADEALRLVRLGFEQGKFGLIDLLDTQRTAAHARLAYQRRLVELNTAQAELESLTRPTSDPIKPSHSVLPTVPPWTPNSQ